MLNSFHPRPHRLLASFITVAATHLAQAEDSVTVKAQSWQEDDKRVRVDSQYALLQTDLTTETRLKIMGLVDTITGATPTGEKSAAPGAPVPLSEMDDRREAWDANLAYQFPRVNVSAGCGVSRESDYVSHGYALNTLTDFNQKNTLLLVGWGHADDRVVERFWSADREKTGDDFIVGITQLLSPVLSVTANLSCGRATGFLADPYKIVSTTRLDLDPGTYYTVPENRPDEKDKVSLFLGAVRHFDPVDGAIDASYRFYHDSFGIDAHTVDLKWVQRLGPRWMLEPSVRFHHQSAADFYHADLDADGVVVSLDPSLETGTARVPYYSSDYRLSRMETTTLGLKAAYALNDHVSIDFAYERYLMRGLDDATPRGAYADADVFTVGMKFSR